MSPTNPWQRIGTRRRAGAALALFSFYSKNSFGAGDFADLKLAIDWLQKCGLSILQLLPMNETGALSCPYDSLSSFALEPLYISLRDIPGVKNFKIHPPLARPHLDYSVKEEKMRLVRDIYNLNKGRQGSEGLSQFKEENAYWITDFALYKALKSCEMGKPWYEWEEKYKNRDSSALEDFQREHAEEIDFQSWLQWQLYRQFKAAKEYAKAKKVLLKGDLPFLVSRDSADVWAHREFFKLDFAAGAPPDMYCARGQRWGMPVYNWEKVRAGGFRYLKEKLKFAAEFYDILRIDHVLGLFRIWSIPYNEPLVNQGLKGSFDPPQQEKWQAQAKEILSAMLESTDMLLAAEDLGIIPKMCPQLLEELGIPGNDVQRWVKEWKVKHDFLIPQDYRRLSVAMLSTHDTTNWSAWWENEAGTVDGELFMRKCRERGIDFEKARSRLFDPLRSRRGRLSWLNSVDSVDKLVTYLNEGLNKGLIPKGTVPKEYLMDFIELYENSYCEKEKLWKQLGLPGPMREACDKEIVAAALKITLDSAAVFCINTMVDWLYLAGLFTGDPYQYRINTPGTISADNWSLVIPLALEDLLRHRVTKEIRRMSSASGRI